MIWALVTIGFFYALLWVFERKRTQFDFYDVATVVVAPILASFLVTLGLGVLGLGLWAVLAGALTMIIVTFLVLTKMLTVSAGRASLYTAAVVAFQYLPLFFL